MISPDAERQSSGPIRVAIIEDDRHTRDGLGMLIQGTGSPETGDEQRTPQETRLLKLVVQAYSHQGPAGQLNSSVNTIRRYSRNTYDKLHVHSKSETVSTALRSRLAL